MYSFENKCWGSPACSSKLKEMGMNHDMRPFSLLLNDSVTLLNRELDGLQNAHTLRRSRCLRTQSSTRAQPWADYSSRHKICPV